MIPIARAVEIINRETHTIGAENVALSSSVGRFLAEDVVADCDLPPFDRSQMDGYAVRAEDTVKAPLGLKIAGESAAGRGWHHEMRSGEAVRIMTGAPVPEGADAIQKVELTKEDGEFVTIMEPTETGRFIVGRGSEIKKGETIFKPGEIVTENMIATMAAFGFAETCVAKQPCVSILTTGSEVVEFDQTPGTDQIRNSNSVMLDVLCRKFGAETTVFPIVKDDISNLRSEFENALKNTDLLVITGGVSVGKYDLTKAALHDLGAEIFIEKLRLKPGKPMVFAKLDNTLIFGLPGNPVSAAVTFYLFVRTAILLMQGASQPNLTEGFAVLASDVKAAKERDTYLPAVSATDEKGRLVALSLKWKGSSDFIGFSRANSLIFVPQGDSLRTGEVARVVFL